MRSVLFVCTANICRSPMAEGVLRKLLVDNHLHDAFEVDSVGTHDYHVGEAPFPMAVEVARLRGYDITHLVSRKIRADDFDRFDFILGMDKLNLRNLRTICPTRSKQKIELLLEYGDKFQGQEVPDPYGRQEKDFFLSLDMIEDGCKGLMEMLKMTARREGRSSAA
jgi:protein-tyrosine phosphatase